MAFIISARDPGGEPRALKPAIAGFAVASKRGIHAGTTECSLDEIRVE